MRESFQKYRWRRHVKPFPVNIKSARDLALKCLIFTFKAIAHLKSSPFLKESPEMRCVIPFPGPKQVCYLQILCPCQIVIIKIAAEKSESSMPKTQSKCMNCHRPCSKRQTLAAFDPFKDCGQVLCFCPPY